MTCATRRARRTLVRFHASVHARERACVRMRAPGLAEVDDGDGDVLFGLNYILLDDIELLA